MDRQTLEELFERSAETDMPTLLRAKEEAKRQMRADPSPQNVSVFEKASRMLEAKMDKADQPEKDFSSVNAVLAHLHDCGRKVAKSKLYNDVKAGLLLKHKGGFRRSDVDAYAQGLPLTSVPKEEGENIKRLAQRRQEATIEKIEQETARIRFKGEVERGKYIPRDEVELELASRALVLESGIKQAVEMNVLDLIHLVEGTPNKSQEFLERFEGLLDAALNEYASTAEFEVRIADTGEEESEG